MLLQTLFVLHASISAKRKIESSICVFICSSSSLYQHCNIWVPFHGQDLRWQRIILINTHELIVYQDISSFYTVPHSRLIYASRIFTPARPVLTSLCFMSMHDYFPFRFLSSASFKAAWKHNEKKIGDLRVLHVRFRIRFVWQKWQFWKNWEKPERRGK